jgi:NADP-reducing hydrogenase subunit HndB
MGKKINSVQDLQTVRDTARAQIDLRSGHKDIRITVHMGTCGIAAGARDILLAIMDELGGSAADNATVQPSGCVGLCDQEPMISIIDKAGSVFRYGKLNKSKVRQIIQEHVIRGNPVMEYLLNR